jgi:hypothetical protein
MFKRYRTILISLIIVVILAWLIWAGYRAYWTGFGVKTLWDWMELLIIPAVLGIGALLFNRAGQNAERERTLDKQRQETLTTYFDRMQELLLKHKLRRSKENAEVRIAARARTVSALRNLDGQRIAQLLHFLTESGLGGEKLVRINLDEVDLQRTSLSGVDLQGAKLRHANLQRAYLYGANLQRANLREANLQRANLREANLQRAYLRKAKITPEYLNRAKSLKAATMPDGTKYEEWVAKGKPDWTRIKRKRPK